MARDDYILEGFVQALRRGIQGFATIHQQAQHHLAKLIWNSGLKTRQHSKHEGYMAITFQELYGKFGRKGFQALNEKLNLFEVTANWSMANRYTKGYRLTPKVQAIKTRFLNAHRRKLDNLLMGDGKVLRTPPKAVASKDMDGITASKWKNTKFKSTVPVDIQTLKSLKKYLAALGKDMEAGRWNGHLFFEVETIEQVDHLLEVISQTLTLAHTTAAGKGYVIHRYIESGSGRLYAKGINLQTTPRAVKEAALHGLWEYDFENCHYAIFRHLADQAGVDCPSIDHYLAHKKQVRRQLEADLQLTTDQAKACLIAIMYGARETQWHQAAIPTMLGDKAGLLYRHPLFQGLVGDIQKGRKAILSAWPGKGRSTFMNALGKRIRKEKTPEQILAHLIQGIEAKMLHTALDLYPQDILLLQHDGFAASKRLDKVTVEQAVKEATGIPMALSEDRIQLSENLSFPKRELAFTPSKSISYVEISHPGAS